jgi:hypothetical protein
MRACSYLNTAAACGVLVLSSFAGCGGGETPPPETAASSSETAAPASETESPSTAAPAAESNEESLMGNEDPASHPGASNEKAATPAPGEDTRTSEIVQKMVMEQRATVRKCYEDALKELPGLHGDLVIHFVLDPEGKVKKAELNQEQSTLKSPKVTECAINVIKGIKFPPSSRGMQSEINYPFNLNPQKSQK